MDKKPKFDKKQDNFSTYLSKIDQTNPIQFHIKNNFFYANADIIIFSQSGTEKKSQIDILEEKANYIKIKKKRDQLKQLNPNTMREDSPITKAKKFMKCKLYHRKKNSIAEKKQKDSFANNVLIKKNSSQQKCNLTLNNQKSSESKVLPKVLREKSAQELVDYFSDLSFVHKPSDQGDKKLLSSYQRKRNSLINCLNIRTTFNCTTLSNSNTIVNTEPTETQKTNNHKKTMMLQTINDSDRKNFFGLSKGISSSQTSSHLEIIKSLDLLQKTSSIVNSFYHKTNNSEVSFHLLDTEITNGGEMKDIKRPPKRSFTSIGNMNISKKDCGKDKIEKRMLIEQNMNSLISNKDEYKGYYLPESFKKSYPELVKKFRMIQDYKSNFNEKMIKNNFFQEKLEKKIDEFIQTNEKKLEESKEAFTKQDKIFTDYTKQLLYKTVKKENKKDIKNSPSLLETLRPNIELREFKHLNTIKPKFKKLGDFKLLVIPKEIKEQKRIENPIFPSEKGVSEKVKNVYFKDKITNLKERRFLEKLSVPRNEPTTNKFVKGMIKTCDFIENENIILSNKIKKVSKRLTKRLDFITSKNAYIVTK
jgi:hypothetical protein